MAGSEHTGKLRHVMLYDFDRTQLDVLRRRESDLPSRSEMIRRLIQAAMNPCPSCGARWEGNDPIYSRRLWDASKPPVNGSLKTNLEGEN